MCARIASARNGGDGGAGAADGGSASVARPIPAKRAFPNARHASRRRQDGADLIQVIMAKLTQAERNRIFEELTALVAIEGTSGDEGRMVAHVTEQVAPLAGIQSRRIQDNLIVWRGQPQVALFAHLDTVGFTLGYDREL